MVEVHDLRNTQLEEVQSDNCSDKLDVSDKIFINEYMKELITSTNVIPAMISKVDFF